MLKTCFRTFVNYVFISLIYPLIAAAKISVIWWVDIIAACMTDLQLSWLGVRVSSLSSDLAVLWHLINCMIIIINF